MAAALVELAFVIVCTLCGAAAGWFLRSGGAAGRRAEANARQAREALDRLRELSQSVRADVGQHSDRVREISDELTHIDAEGDGQDAVVKSIANLVEANQRMQEQLASAEERLQKQAEELEENVTLARTDALTGLANRRAFDDELARRLDDWQRRHVPTSLLLLDVDHFKKFNDAHGHQAGDEVLRGVARVLAASMRDVDVVARYGGEEMAVVFPGSKMAEVTVAAERARTAIERSVFQFEGTDLRVTASFGLTDTADGDDAAALIRRADEALYASKNAGRNCTHASDDRTCRLIGPLDRPSNAKEPPPPSAGQPTLDAPAAQPQSVETSLPPAELTNRTAFADEVRRRLAESQRYQSPLSVMLVRIDGYEQLVARHGASAGVTVMRALAQFVSAATREMDLVAQHGQDTFAMLLPGTVAADVAGVAQRLRLAVQRIPLTIDGDQLRFTVSAGVALARGGDDPKDLVLRAQAALDSATQAGGNAIQIADETGCRPTADLIATTP
jgi:diguanylate cyclase